MRSRSIGKRLVGPFCCLGRDYRTQALNYGLMSRTTWDVEAPIETRNGPRLYPLYDPSSAKNKNLVLAKPVGSNNSIHPTAILDRSFTASLYNAAQCTVEVSFLPLPSFPAHHDTSRRCSNEPPYPWIPPRNTLRTWRNLHVLGAAAVAWMWMCPLAHQ